MELPEVLQPYKSKGEALIEKGLVRDVLFSRKTYQVLVNDAKTGEELWTLVHLDDAGHWSDGFCSCDEAEETGGCAHLAAAMRKVYSDRDQPLHRRFDHSFWKAVTFSCFQRFGDDPTQLKKADDDTYSLNGSAAAPVTIKAMTKDGRERLREILEERQEETEETSIKFSDLPPEELEAWQEGVPSEALRYELSYWSDLAKWMMLQQERDYKLEFSEKEGALPEEAQATFEALSVHFPIQKEEWEKLVPALAELKASLEVKDQGDGGIDSMTFDTRMHRLVIHRKESTSSAKARVQGVSVGRWTYVPKQGFYAVEEMEELSGNYVTLEALVDLLEEHGELVAHYLKDETVDRAELEVRPHVYFDAKGDLCIDGYHKEPGDLKGAVPFADWAYVPGYGFRKLQQPYDPLLFQVIPYGEVADFVTEHRSWLNAYPGFETHLAPVNTYLGFEVLEDGTLVFSTYLETSDEGTVTREYGRWLYIEGQGFFTKKAGWGSEEIWGGLRVPPGQVPSFIRKHGEDLGQIPNLFAGRCPLHKTCLNVEVNEKGGISITPVYEMLPDYRHRKVHLYSQLCYVEGEGFSEFPTGMILPDEFAIPVTIEPKQVPSFVTLGLDPLRKYIGHLDPRLEKPKKVQLGIEQVTADRMSSEGKVYLQMQYGSEQGLCSAIDAWKGVQSKQRFLFTDAGMMDLSSELFRWLHWIPEDAVNEKDGTLALSTLDLLRLKAFVEVEVQPDDERLSRLYKLLEGEYSADKPNLEGLRSTLRPYQHVGVEWLWFLYRYRLSGLLCDDMGLGKTHQAMALLAAVGNSYRFKREGKSAKYLVVCPTSVLFHWQDKLEEFLPGIRVRTYYGTQRTLESGKNPYDLILTSYGIARREHEKLADIHFNVAVFDEVQVAKNQKSNIHKALSGLDVEMRVGLTGTPLENRLTELRALFDLTLPGYMPGEAEYREVFVNPIERYGDEDRQNLLKRFIRPFLLRRRKQEVLSELPDKTEDIVHCYLETDQRKLYEELLGKTGDKLIKELEDDTKKVSYIHIFALLSLLKQVCNHPAAYLKETQDYKKYRSGKWELFKELLSEARASQQKVVVFSHYLGMLDIMEMYLKEQGIPYATVRGSTRNRAEEVKRFQSDPECEVFLGSLQAVGMGIDLTAASVVIHYDRWWNPAKEDQATDRVHRIGQHKGVQVFKLVSRDTLEDRIDQLIARKRRLFEGVVEADEDGILKKFDRGELISLLQHIHGAAVDSVRDDE